MHAEVAPRHPAQRDEGLGRAVAWAVGLHLLLAVLLIVSPLLTWDRDRLNAAGAPTMEATLADNSFWACRMSSPCLVARSNRAQAEASGRSRPKAMRLSRSSVVFAWV